MNEKCACGKPALPHEPQLEGVFAGRKARTCGEKACEQAALQVYLQKRIAFHRYRHSMNGGSIR